MYTYIYMCVCVCVYMYTCIRIYICRTPECVRSSILGESTGGVCKDLLLLPTLRVSSDICFARFFID